MLMWFSRQFGVMKQCAATCLLMAMLSLWTCEPTFAMTRPNIVLLVVDDLGWNDVSLHESTQIKTPNLDVMASDGVILNNYYVTPLCTPSRAALLTGKYPIRLGLQHDEIRAAEPFGLPLEFKLLPQYLKELGYETHAVGKWHLGHMTANYTPTYRGFDSHYGPYTDHQDYSDHTSFSMFSTDNDTWTGWGLDMWDNLNPDQESSGKYATSLFTEKAIEVLKKRNQNRPIFLYLCYSAVHVGNSYSLLEAPEEDLRKHSHIMNLKRRSYAAMVSALDDSIGEIMKALLFTNAIKDTILVVTTDNGAAAGGVDGSAGSNWPLRGTKGTLWEGGIRAVGFVWSTFIKRPHVAHQLMHITDWLPTLYAAAGGKVDDLGEIDGHNMWDTLIADNVSPRSEILINIDPVWNTSAFRYHGYKLVQGSLARGRYDGWYRPTEPGGQPVNMNRIRSQFFHAATPFNAKCAAARTIRAMGRPMPTQRPDELFVVCGHNNGTSCYPMWQPCLFNIDSDPCERDNIAKEHPDIVDFLQLRMKQYRKKMVPPLNQPATRKADPRNFNYTWAPFM
nr:arylsulfatase B-like [Rhipicephalus microplus]